MKAKYLISAVFALIIPFLTGPLAGENSQLTRGSEPLAVETGFTRDSVSARADILVDESASVSIEEILAGQIPPFVRSSSAAPGYGYTDRVIWFRFSIDYRGEPGRNLLLEVDNPLIDKIDLFIMGKGGLAKKTLGDRVPFIEREIDYRNPVFSLKPDLGNNLYYMRFASDSNMNLKVTLWDPDSFYRAIAGELPLQWLFNGILLALALYNLFLFVSIRDRSYIYYVLFVSGFLFFRISYNGLSFQYLWPGSIWWANVCVPFFVAFLTLFAILFTKTYLDTNMDQPLVNKILKALAALFVIYLPLSLVLPYSVAIRVTLGTALLTLFILILSGLISLFRGRREGRYYILAWGLFLAGSVLNIFRDFGIIETGIVALWSQQAGTALQALLLSFALADRINIMKKQIIEANDTIIETCIKLDSERELLAVTMRSIVDSVITTDLTGRIIMMNSSAARILIKNPASCTGENITSILKISDGQSSFETDYTSAAALHVNLDTASGDLIEAEITRSPLRDSESKIIGYVYVVRDVTEKRLIERETIRSNRLEALGAMAGGIAHDFNNILTAISANISLARISGDDPGEHSRIFTDMERAMESAKHLTSQLSSFTSGGAPMKKEYRLQEIIRDTVQFTLSGANVTVEFDIEEDLWSADVDGGQIGQVVNNLVLNSVQAMPGGGTVTVSARNLLVEEGSLSPFPPGFYSVISIRDTGPGIDQEHIDRIFDPFFTTKSDGTGLGLFSVHNIIKNHGGALDVWSEHEKGTLFTIYLPATGRCLESACHLSPAGPISGPAYTVGFKGSILLMDDEELVSRAARRLLSKMGYMVDTVSNSSQTLAHYEARMKSGARYDAVILDLTIPGGPGGVETMRLIKEIDPAAKCIVSSGYSIDPVIVSWSDWGFVGAIIKPYSMEDLVLTLNEALGDS